MLNRTGKILVFVLTLQRRIKFINVSDSSTRAARQNSPLQKKLKLMQTAHHGNLDKNFGRQRLSILAFE